MIRRNVRSRCLVAFLGTGLVIWAAAGNSALNASSGRPQNVSQTAGSAAPALESLLKRAADYCRKLEAAGLNFVCREEIKETIDPTLDVKSRFSEERGWSGASESMSPRVTYVGVNVKKRKGSYVYDYQCVRQGGAITERRTLIVENGKPRSEPNAALKTSVVVFGTALLGPVGLFGERFQPDYVYTITGRDKVDGRPVVVIDARPRPGARDSTNLYGKAWVDPATADILRIEWSESRVGRREIFEQRGEKYGRTPRLIIRSEFSAEKNGIRFPSRLTIKETYVSKGGMDFKRSETEVTYKDFKFFTVEVEVR